MFFVVSQMTYLCGEISVYGVICVMLKFPNRGVECIPKCAPEKSAMIFFR